jgi:hypothetical protein
LIGRFLGREPLCTERAHALGIALGHGGDDTRLARAGAGRAGVTSSQLELGLDVVVPELEQQVAGHDALAVLDGQARDLAAHGRREPGATARVDGAGARVRDRRRHGPALGGHERHRDGRWTREVPAGGERDERERGDDRDALHGHISRRGGAVYRIGASVYQLRKAPVSRWTKLDSG